VSGPWRWAGLLALAPVGLLAGPGARAIGRRGTTLNPFGEPTALVTDGPYRFTRNPLYLSLALLLVGAATGLGSATPFLVVPGFVAAINVGFIRREEAALAAAFGEDFRRYCARVRRWL
jgi:protein-S-isoprenylcysteine O-methyltransferase Ste14